MSYKLQQGQIDVGEGLLVQSLEKPKLAKTVLFMRVGKEGVNKSGIEGMDMATIFMNLTTAGNWLFWTLVERRNVRTNIAEFKSADMTVSNKRKASKGYKELHALDVVVRTKQNNYLLNPKAILPRKNEDFADVWEMWEGFAG